MKEIFLFFVAKFSFISQPGAYQNVLKYSSCYQLTSK